MEVSSSEALVLEGLKQTNPNKSKQKDSASLVSGQGSDNFSSAIKSQSESLSILANKVIDKLDEMLREELPEGIRSLDPEEYTPEKTASRIVDTVTALMPIYERQNPGKEGEELLTSFVDTIKSGITQGFEEAKEILQALGAFEIEGVESGIEETRSLINDKLLDFETNYRKQNGLEPLATSSDLAKKTEEQV